MHFGVIGDVHGEFDALHAVMGRHPDVVFWLSVGDVASDDLRYPEPVAPLYWIQGNNEDFGFIAHLCLTGLRPCDGPVNLHFLPNGTCTVVDGLAVGALGGTFAPTWYETPAADLPYPGTAKALPYRSASGRASAGQGFSPARVRDDKRRHFVREQVEALKAKGQGAVDVLLTHEAARPFIVQAGARRIDAGKTPINELLAALQPRLHFFGHHHRFSDTVRGRTRSIGLDLVTRSYVLVDRQTFEITKVDTEA